MKKINFLTLFLIVLIIVSSTCVFAIRTVNDFELLEINQIITGGVNISKTTNDFSVSSFTIKLNHFPKTDLHQDVINEVFTPIGESQTETSRTFIWTGDEISNNLNFRYVAQIKLNNNQIKIKKKVNSPVTGITVDALPYLKLTETINVNEDIIRKAQELAQGKTDLFELEFEIAQFVKNHANYSLSIYTADDNKPSTWVYQNKIGACDEFTNLFISINRELGIPARFVSGIAYSDSELLDSKWGNHAWAEVYFPNYGWIPFDLTYNQLGWIDATHIILGKEVDGSMPSIVSQGTGKGFNFEQKTLKFETEVISMKNEREDIVSVDLNVKEKIVGFDSFNLIEATISNLNDFYTIQSFQLAQTTNLKNFDSLTKVIFLKPYEKKKIYWLVQVENLKKGYDYSFPIKVFTENENEINGQFEVKENEMKYDKEYMTKFISEDSREYIQRTKLTCNGLNNILQNSEKKMECEISQNKDVENVSQFDVCLNSQCMKLNFDQLEYININFDLNTEELGAQTVVINVKNNDFSEDHFITYIVNDISSFEIKNITSKTDVTYDEKFKFSFLGEKTSFSNIDNLIIKIKHDNFEKRLFFETYNSSRVFEFELEGRILNAGENNLEIYFEYENTKGEKIIETYPFKINLINLTFEQKIALFFDGISNKAVKLTNNYYQNKGRELTELELQKYSTIVLVSFYSTMIIVILILVKLTSVIIKMRKNEIEIEEILKNKK